MAYQYRRHYNTIDRTIIRNEEKLEVTVEYILEPADPECGLMCEGADIQRVLLDEKDITDKLLPSEIDWLQQQATRDAQESTYNSYGD